MRVLLASGFLASVCLANEFPEIEAVLGKYPGYEGSLSFAGNVKLNGNSNTVTLSHLIGNLELDSVGKISINEGMGCADADAVGGPYWNTESQSLNPWTESKWDSTRPGFVGFSTGTFTISNGVAFGYNEMIGHAVVVYDSSDNPVACAVIGGPTIRSGETKACLDVYPGYTGSLDGVEGTIALAGSEGDLELSWIINGLPNDSSGTVAVHDGASCDSADTVGSSIGTAFWDSTGAGAAGGLVTGLQAFADGSLGQYGDILGATVVVSDNGGNAFACGVLDDCAVGSGEGTGSASGLPPGIPVKCKDVKKGGEDFCEDRSDGFLTYNKNKKDKECHKNVQAGENAKANKCLPICCCKKKWRQMKSKKCEKIADNLPTMQKCDPYNRLNTKCRAYGERVPNGGSVWDINNCGEYDVYEVKCK